MTGFIPSDADPSVQQALREIWTALEALTQGDIDLGQSRRIVNGLPGINPDDYILLRQLQPDPSLEEPKPVIPPHDHSIEEQGGNLVYPVVSNPKIGHLASDAVKTANTTLADLTGVSFTIGASERWAFVVVIFIDSNGTANAKYAINAPSGAAGVWGHIEGLSTAFDGTTALPKQALASDEVHILHGSVLNGGTGGTVQVKWAQSVASGTTTIFAGSHLIAWRVS